MVGWAHVRSQLATEAELAVETVRARGLFVARAAVVARLAELAVEASLSCISSIDAFSSARTVPSDCDRARFSSWARLAGAVAGVERARFAQGVVSSRLVLALEARWALHAVGLADISEPAVWALDGNLSRLWGVVASRGDLAVIHT